MSDADQRKKAFTIGYLAGLCGMPLAIAPGRKAGSPAGVQKYSYNGVILPGFSEYLDKYYDYHIFRHETEDSYIMVCSFYSMTWVYGVFEYVGIPMGVDKDIRVWTCPAGGDVWTAADPEAYMVIDQYNDTSYYRIGKLENLVWAEENCYYASNANIAFYGSEQVPVTEPEVNNKAIMLGCRLGYIIRAQLGKGNIEIPNGVLISSDGYILTDCNGVYLIAAVAAEPDEPDEPGEVATMYLYGTPSESGNIGLRNGDSVTYHDGAVLLNIDTVYTDELKKSHPFAGIMTVNGNYMLVVTDAKAVQNTGFLPSCSWDTEDGQCAFVSWVYSELSDWEFSTSSEHGSPVAGSCKWKWANHDVYNQSGNLYLSTIDPIPVGEIVDYINDIPIYEREDA